MTKISKISITSDQNDRNFVESHEKNVQNYGVCGQCTKVRCKSYAWRYRPHTSRMRQHLIEQHSTSLSVICNGPSDGSSSDSDATCQSSEPKTPVGAKGSRQVHIARFADRHFSSAEQDLCTLLLARAAVMNDWSQNSVSSSVVTHPERVHSTSQEFHPPNPTQTPYKTQ